MRWFLWFPMPVLLLLAAVPVSCAEPDVVAEPGGEGGADPLPKITDIESMKASYFDPAQKAVVQFTVPQPHWSKIRDALAPARRDDNPARWKVLGDLEIKKKGSGQVHVSLYSTSADAGAFAMAAAGKQRVYYRGGQSAKLKQALRAAYEASRQAP
jgi:hypothetical protein